MLYWQLLNLVIFEYILNMYYVRNVDDSYYQLDLRHAIIN